MISIPAKFYAVIVAHKTNPMLFSNVVLIAVIITCSYVQCVSVPRRPQQVHQITIQMPGYSPDMDDDYVAVAVKATPGYIFKFEPIAQADRIHHILLYGCDAPALDQKLWKGGYTCRGAAHILYAWARNAPSLSLPEGVAFSVGHETDTIRYFVMQVHYAHPFTGKVLDYSGLSLHMIDERPPNLAAVLLFASDGSIPPKFSHYQTNMSCIYRGDAELHPFAFRTHTHSMGRVVSAFYKNNGNWTMIGKRNPQWPQLFQPVGRHLTIRKNDLMAATCVYDSSQQTRTISMGSTGGDEMCNFYMMFYWDAELDDPFPRGAVCAYHEESKLVANEYPEEGVSLLPKHPELEEKAHQDPDPYGFSSGLQTESIGGYDLGQVSGLSFDQYGNLFVFHRGSRKWDRNTFNVETNRIVNEQPIPDHVIFVVKSDGNKFSLIAKYGAKQFFMPHGIYVDENNDIYTTDVGSHQVIKWTVASGMFSSGRLKQVFALGEKFVPGSDKNHFCKPTSVVTSSDGSLFIADGYCNGRIVKFDGSGRYVGEWGQRASMQFSGMSPSPPVGAFNIPHDISRNEDGSLLYISDRENARIQIYRSAGDGIGLITNPENQKIFFNIFSAFYHGDAVYFIPGDVVNGVSLKIFSAHAASARVQFSFEPTGFSFERPHIIRVSPDGKFIYVGELGRNKGRLTQILTRKPKTEMGINPSGQQARMTDSAFLWSDRDSISSVQMIWILLFGTTFVTAALYYLYKRSQTNRIFLQRSVLDRAGFKPLRTEDGSDDDDSDDASIVARKNFDHRF
ncbi:hypothetical protein AB6A40_002128 [Gnathostoma spinigerum]|uniref:Peptidylglycine monooxygenase n=1 Tax=Gnathostoma spinigerum TaxID=75299 RepID=A0ABD6E5U2_9BILA